MNGIVVFVAIVALASAVEEKKPVQGQVEEGQHRGLQWPLPDPSNEGDLILHGAYFFDRVGELRKAKSDNDVDKMILTVGRNFLRRAHKYLESTPDFKIPPVLCRDTRHLNSTKRWQIRIEGETQPTTIVASENQDQNQENKQQAQNEQQQQNKQQQQQQQNDAPQSTSNNKQQQQQPQQQQQQQNDAPQNNNNNKQQQQNDEQSSKNGGKSKQQADDAIKKGFNNNNNNTNENATNQQQERLNTYEGQEEDFYERMGSNFARLLLKQYRKEQMIPEETQYLDRWLDEEAVHYGVVGIYCQEGENVKDIVKQLNVYIDEKQQ